ncbi:MAG: response regulator [Alphaproteobacteria bacterium]|nr:response regulator [Alphaproteobacteria bacterium]MBV8548954.1 response regulator [Alphaproteobacteria bacterium]
MHSSQQLKILIVDDHFLARQIVTNVLREHNIEAVDTATNGNEAKEAICNAFEQHKPYDIVFLDWNMPGMEGIDVLAHFRADSRFNKTAFVMLTAAADQSDVIRAIKAGATGYIVKPVSRSTVSKKLVEVQEWLKNAQR